MPENRGDELGTQIENTTDAISKAIGVATAGIAFAAAIWYYTQGVVVATVPWAIVGYLLLVEVKNGE